MTQANITFDDLSLPPSDAEEPDNDQEIDPAPTADPTPSSPDADPKLAQHQATAENNPPSADHEAAGPNEAESFRPDDDDEDGADDSADDDQPTEDETNQQPEQQQDLQPAQDFTKVVIYLQSSTTTISVQRSSTDPKWLTTNDSDINQALARVPAFLEQAQQQWDEVPLYQKAAQKAKQPVAPTPPKVTAQPPDKNQNQAPRLL